MFDWLNWWFYRKGSEIWANHNIRTCSHSQQDIGDSTAKVVKFEQITTSSGQIQVGKQLVILPQR